MPAYMLFLREEPLRDPEALATYQSMTRALPPNPELKPLVLYGATEAVEGEAPDGVIILEFPSVEAARTWYESPEYQTAIPHRQRAGAYRAMIVEGFAPPLSR